DVNSAVTFVTGHNAGGDVPDGLDWEALARGSPVLVFYMALKHLVLIRDRLIGAGRKPGDAVAIVCKAATKAQMVIETTLGDCVERATSTGAEPPAMVVVGDAVRLRGGLDWHGAIEHGRALDPDPLRLKRRQEAG